MKINYMEVFIMFIGLLMIVMGGLLVFAGTSRVMDSTKK